MVTSIFSFFFTKNSIVTNIYDIEAHKEFKNVVARTAY